MATEIVGAIILRDNNLLLVNNRGNWTLLGGEKNLGEGDLECLLREVDEEFAGTVIHPGKFYKNFEGVSPRNRTQVSLRTYFCEMKGKRGSPTDPEGDIIESQWINDFSRYNLSELTKEVVQALRSDGYLS